MKPDEPISHPPAKVFKPHPPIPCGEKCEFIYWRAIKKADIEVQEAKRYTLMLMQDDRPELECGLVANRKDFPVTGPMYNGPKLGSGVDLDKSNLSSKVKDQLYERFLKAPGELMNSDCCQWPCECVRDRNSKPEDAGQGEENINLLIDYDEIIAQFQVRNIAGETNNPPSVKNKTDSNGKPVPFDPETDILSVFGLGGPNWVIWSVIRRYRAVLTVKIKYQATRFLGTCKELTEV